MLSTHYREVKRLRSTGRCADAISSLTAARPESDEDAFEAAVCLLVCGQIDNAVHVCRTYPWKSEWARNGSTAFSDILAGGNDERALTLARAAVADPAAPLDVSAVYLLVLQKSGLRDEADSYIAKRWQDPPEGETFLLTLMAEIAVASRDWRQAFRCACAVLAADPDDYRAFIVLSVANYEDGNIHESLGNARRAGTLSPGSASAVLQVMRCQNKLGDHYAAVAEFAKLADRESIAANLYVELGKAHAGLSRKTDAIDAYQRALATDPQAVEAVRALVSLLASAGDTAAVDALVDRHTALIEGDVDSMYWRGLAALNAGRLEQSATLLRRGFAVSETRNDALDSLPWPVPEPRVRHDFEQLELLQRRGVLNEAGREALNVLKPYYERSGDVSSSFAPTGAQAEAFKRALTTPYYVPDAPFTMRALGANDYAAIEQKYSAERLAVIDGFLSAEALSALRTFCEEATVWKSYNKHGYVGALIALGFSPRVLLAIADELRRAMPHVIGDEPLLQAWGFKYDQRMQGINMHADFAKVNVNFWITPESACADPTTGGMVVYDLPVPKSWTFADYNTDPGRLAAYVKLNGAKPMRVPYRENRCVIFDSSLIHVTDEIRFKPGYENRRVNVTLLYGQGLSVE